MESEGRGFGEKGGVKVEKRKKGKERKRRRRYKKSEENRRKSKKGVKVEIKIEKWENEERKRNVIIKEVKSVKGC